jgi:hypothetical protein
VSPVSDRAGAIERAEARAPSPHTPRWIRHRPSGKENLTALAAGLGVGLAVGGAVYYLARLVLAREPLSPGPSRGEREGA